MGLFDDILNGAELPDAASEKIKKESPKKKSKAEKKEEKKEDTKQIGGLPSGFIDILESIINDYCLKYDIEDMKKASQGQWSAACMLIGQYIRENNINVDAERSGEKGQKVFSISKLDNIADIWGYLCGVYKKTPLISDFLRFSAVSESWLYDYGNHKLTTDGREIYKKVLKMQEFGVASDLADGRKNPTGLIFLSKAKMGWSESGSIRPQTDQADTKSLNLPDFNNLGLPKL